jgi:hypothetical protein
MLRWLRQTDTVNSVIGPGFDALTSSSPKLATAIATASYRLSASIYIDAMENAVGIGEGDTAP